MNPSILVLLYSYIPILLPPAGAAVRYHFLFVAVCVFACLLICRCLYVSNGLSMFVSMFVCQWSVDRRSACMSASVYLYLYASASVICLSASVCVYLSICVYLSADCVCLSVCVYYLSVYLYAFFYRIYLRVCHCLCVHLARSVCRSVYLPIGRSVITRCVCLWPVCLCACLWLYMS